MRNHIIPMYYQIGFVDVHSKIWTYRRGATEPFCATPRKTGVEKGYYSDNNEKYLAEQIEQPALEVIQKIRHRQFISPTNKKALARYLASFIMRVRAGKPLLSAASPKAFSDVFSVENLANTFGHKPTPRELVQANALRRQWENNVTDEFYQYVVPQDLTRSWNALNAMTWQFLTFDGEPAFVTSDNPLFYFRELGIGRPLSEVTFPISQNIVLLASWKTDAIPGYFPVTKSIVSEINHRTASISTRDVFFSAKEDWIVDLVRQKTPAPHRIVANDKSQHILQSF